MIEVLQYSCTSDLRHKFYPPRSKEYCGIASDFRLVIAIPGLNCQSRDPELLIAVIYLSPAHHQSPSLAPIVVTSFRAYEC